MNDFIGIYTEKERNKKTSSEFSKLWKLYRDDDNPHNEQVKRLCQEAAFLRITLQELRQMIMRDGYIESYQNGANQYGLKKSSAVEIYDKMIGQYLKVISQLNKLLPEPESIDEAQREILDFISAGNRQSE